MSSYTDHDTLTETRRAAIRAVAENPRAVIVPNLRRWLVHHGYIAPAEPKRGPRACGANHKRMAPFPVRAHAVTELGRQALEQGEQR